MSDSKGAAIDEILDEIYQDKNTLGDLPIDRDLAKQAILAILDQEVNEYKEALEDVVWQYAYKSDGAGRRPPMMLTGGMSALEHAFGVLDWPDPKPCPDSSCDIKGCQRWRGCGMPRPDGDYWNICGHHMGLIDMGDTSLEKKPGRGYNAKERKDRLERLG